MHWTIRMMVAAACLASLTWTAEVTGNDLETEIDTVQYDDAIDPAERIISVGNVDTTKYTIEAALAFTGVWLGILTVFAEFVKGIGARVYPKEGDEEKFIKWFQTARASPATATSLLERALAGIDSINTRMQSEDRAVCRKLSLCQMGSVTSGFTLIHTFFQILRPVFPEIDDSWEGLMAGEARQDCNTLYPECPKAILRAVFGNIN